MCNKGMGKTISRMLSCWNGSSLIEYHFLTEGRINLLFKVRFLSDHQYKDAILRICVVDSGPFCQMQGREIYLQSIAQQEQWDFFPEIYFYDESRTVIPYPFMLMEYIEGNTLEDNARPEELFRVGERLAKVHKAGILSFGKNPLLQGPVSGSEYYSSFFESAYFFCRKTNSQMADKFLKIYESYFEKELYKGVSPSLIHHDFHSRNVMFCKDGTLKIIDWDSSRGGIPEYDFIKMKYFNQVNWSNEQMQYFLDGYLTERNINMDVNLCIYEICWLMRMYVFECNNETTDRYYPSAEFYKDRFRAYCERFDDIQRNVKNDWKCFWNVGSGQNG